MTLQDPTTRYPEPEQPEQDQPHPGTFRAMDPAPDHGETSYVGSGRLQGRRALVTGGDSGIGRAVAIAFAREGADVVINHLPEEEDDAQDTVRLLREAGRTALAVPGDLTSEAFCAELVERTVAELGGLDLLVNNAAHQMAQEGGIADITSEQFDRVFKTNVYAMFWLCKAALPHLQPGSCILNTSSVQAYEPDAMLLDYASTKGAIVTFTKALAQDLASRGVRVNTVAPGPIWTPLIPATMPTEMVKEFGGQTPLGRVGQPVEVAHAFVFLASDAASYITGERVTVAGGMPMP